MKPPAPVRYQTVYLWTCPDCGVIWQARHRPRTGRALVCAAGPEQRALGTADKVYRSVAAPGCGVVHTSSGRRGGIAPDVSL